MRDAVLHGQPGHEPKHVKLLFVVSICLLCHAFVVSLVVV